MTNSVWGRVGRSAGSCVSSVSQEVLFFRHLKAVGYRLQVPPLVDGQINHRLYHLPTIHTCNLRALVLIKCENLPFVHALNPGRNWYALCPDLEELAPYIGI